MFKLTFDDARFFKGCIDALVSLIDEGEFEVGKNGMALRAMDTAQIAMVDFMMPKETFKEADADKEHRIGLNIENLSRVMSRTRQGEALTVTLDDSGNRLVLIFKGKGRRTVSIPLLDLNLVETKEPNIPFDSTVKIDSNSLKEGLKDAALVSSYVILSVKDNMFVIEARGDNGEVKNELTVEDGSLISVDLKDSSRAMFPLDYLNDILKGAPSDSVVTLELKSDAPLRLSYKIQDAKFRYYLAPRIEG